MSERLNNKSTLKDIRRAFRNNPTVEEAFLWRHLKHSKLRGRKFRRQHSFGNIIMDFYCPGEKLAVELDGAPHFTPEGKISDSERDQILESYGIKVLRFKNSEVTADIDAVLARISEEFR
ncbi:MAG TPA: DUF559 domain-containing protein [Cyclobacteriaceae bacterium]|nr:DUF559 domain-containing protein [Cyclobacteriaceae bacterium]